MALEQHPVPQQISSYQFRLVGDMTLKQFFQLAAGAGIGLLIYGTPLPGVIKWPLIIFFVIMGAAFAFLPVQDRPLSIWLLAFFRSVYSPTIFTWKREEQPVYFAPEESETPSLSEAGETPQTQGDIQAQFGEVASTFLENLEGAEDRYLSKITGLFRHGSSEEPKQTEVAKVVNEVSPAIPAIPHFQNQLAATPSPIPVQPEPIKPIETAPVTSEQAGYYRPIPKPPTAPSAPQVSTFSPTVNTPPVASQPVYEDKPIFAAPSPISPQPENPLFQPPEFPSPPQVENLVPNATQNIFDGIAQNPPTVPVFQTVNSQVEQVPDKFAGLETPTQANIIVGKIMDINENPISNAIMEIKDEFGRPVRALKTDKDGKFRIVTPLHDGKYTIYTEKDDYEFDPIQLELQDTIVEPMIVEAKKH